MVHIAHTRQQVAADIQYRRELSLATIESERIDEEDEKSRIQLLLLHESTISDEQERTPRANEKSTKPN